MVNRPALYASPGPAHSPACMKRLLPFLLAAGPPALVLLLALAMVVVGAPAGMTTTTMATMADMADCTDDTDTTAAAATGTTVTPNDVAVSLARAFAKAGYSRASTAGVLGVIQFESGMNPAQEQIGEPDPMLRGYGLNQWTPRSKIRDWMDANHVSGEDSADPHARRHRADRFQQPFPRRRQGRGARAHRQRPAHVVAEGRQSRGCGRRLDGRLRAPLLGGPA